MTRLVLASQSESRRCILEAAGVSFTVRRPAADESAIKAARPNVRADPVGMARSLAVEKARSVAVERDEIVLGADQILACNGVMFDKALNLDEARRVLMALRGREHHLVTAMALVRETEIVWQHEETARLWMRNFSTAFLDAYLVESNGDILSSVGCYHVEGRGAQLFDRIEGDQFAVRGLPLIPLLAALRRFEVVPS